MEIFGRTGRRVTALSPLARMVILGVTLLAVARQAGAQSTCEATELGMRADGTDNVAALTKILTQCAGKTIHIARGTYVFDPNGFAAGLTVPTGTTILGDGAQAPQATTLHVGNRGTFQALLWIRNASNVTIRGLRFEGSSFDSGCARHLDYGHAIYMQSDAGKSPGVDNVDVSDNLFYNFNGQSWVTLNAADGSIGIGSGGPISIKNNVFVSDANLAGGCAGTLGIEYPVPMIWMHGSDASGQGLVANVTVASNRFHAGFVKSGIAMWSGTKNIDVLNNEILDAGLHLPPPPGTELGRYGILIYNSAHEHPGLHPDGVRVMGNTITNPVSCGVYVAVGKNLTITGNRISGQSDRHDGTLPKGAISLNHAESVLALQDNDLSNNYIGISSVGSRVNMGNNNIVVPPGGKRDRIVP